MAFNLNDVIKVENQKFASKVGNSNLTSPDNKFTKYNYEYDPAFGGNDSGNNKKEYIPKKFNEEIAKQNKQSYYVELPKVLWTQIPKGSMIRYVDKDGYFSYGGFVLEQAKGKGIKNPDNKGKRYIRLKSPNPNSKPWTIWLHEVQKIFEKQKPGSSTPNTAKILKSIGIDSESDESISSNTVPRTRSLDVELEDLNLKTKVKRLESRLQIFEENCEKRISDLENAVRRMYLAINGISKKLRTIR